MEFLTIYNATLSKSEEEIASGNDVLFWYPQSVNLDEKVRNIGLAQTLVLFTNSFNTSKPCEIVHTDNSRIGLLQLENDFYLMIVKAQAVIYLSLRLYLYRNSKPRRKSWQIIY